MGNPVYEETYALLCALLRAARKNAGLTQIELAEILGEPQQYVSRVEKGERRLDVVELCAWCMALDISASEFIEQIEASVAKMVRLNEALRGEKSGEVAELKKKPIRPKHAKPKR